MTDTDTTQPVKEKATPDSQTADLLPEEINDQAYPDTPREKLRYSATVEKKDSPKVEAESILKKKEDTPKEPENGNRAIVNGGLDLKHIPYEGQPATAASMIYTIYNGGPPTLYCFWLWYFCGTKCHFDGRSQLFRS